MKTQSRLDRTAATLRVAGEAGHAGQRIPATRSVAAIVALMFALALTGCAGGYAIEGRVVRGSIANIQLVDKDDPRLAEPNPTGGGAVILAVYQPQTPTETKSLGRHVTNGQGRFRIPVDAFGAGFFEDQAQIIARRDGHQGAMATIDLPRRGQRVLITLPLGADTLKVPEDYLDRVLRDASPYLEENR